MESNENELNKKQQRVAHVHWFEGADLKRRNRRAIPSIAAANLVHSKEFFFKSVECASASLASLW